MLVVDRHTLRAVDLLDLVDEVDLHLARALHAQHLVRVGRAFHQLLADLDVVAVGEQPLGAVLVLEHPQPLTLGELVVDDFLATVVGNDGDLVEALALLEPDPTGDVGDRRLAPRHAGLEQLLHTGQTAGDVLTGTPPWWKVRMVSCVPGSPMDCAATMPTASPMSTSLPVAIERP